eukprot:Rhum_TRINITY_DN14409_c8_g2::Rhum_TRINITY_DN14409_c8_g2_i1::g.88349::m.88349/K08239/GNPTAB; UDP-N-acetylglucosamine-lysosomal-enzyme
MERRAAGSLIACGRPAIYLLLSVCILSGYTALRNAERLFHVSTLTSGIVPGASSSRHFHENIAGRTYEDFLCHEPVDVVYTWVNGSDPWMLSNIHHYKALEEDEDDASPHSSSTATFTATASAGGPSEEKEDKANPSRFQDNQELRYSLRSLWRNAGWVRNVYVVTNGQIPSWLNLDHPRLRVVPHHDLYTNLTHLPVFASPSIECHLHRIPGLSERFIYMNDDVFFGKTIHPEDFYSDLVGHRIFLSWPVPNCDEGCPSNWVGDGYCDKPCNNAQCDFDAGDCAEQNKKEAAAGYSGGSGGVGTDGSPVADWGEQAAKKPWALATCRESCPDSWLSDKFCDRNCDFAECGFDGMDCIGEGLTNEVRGSLAYTWNRGPAEPATNASANATAEGVAETRPLYYAVEATPDHCARAWDLAAGGAAAGADLLAAEEYTVPRDVAGVFVNVSCFEGTVVEGSFENDAEDLQDELVRVAAVSQHQRLLLVLLKNEVLELFTGRFSLVFEVAGSEGVTTRYSTLFNLTFAGAETAAPHVEGGGGDVVTSSVGGVASGSDATDVAAAPADVGNDAPQDSEDSDNAGAAVASAAAARKLLGVVEAAEGTDVVRLVNLRPRKQQEKQRPAQGQQEKGASAGQGRKLLSTEAAQLPLVQGLMGERWLQHYERQVQLLTGVSADDADAGAVDGDLVRNQRRLLDTFGDSLKHVNKLMSTRFGSTARRVPSHMPHFIDSRVVREMHGEWSEKFDNTSAHRFRSAWDMQYSFAHMYWVTHADDPPSAYRFFDEEIDLNGNGVLDEAELRRTALFFLEHGLTVEELKEAVVPPGYEGLQAVVDELLEKARGDAGSGSSGSSGGSASGEGSDARQQRAAAAAEVSAEELGGRLAELWRANMSNGEDVGGGSGEAAPSRYFEFDAGELLAHAEEGDGDDDVAAAGATPTPTLAAEKTAAATATAVAAGVTGNATREVHCSMVLLPFAAANGSVYFEEHRVCEEVAGTNVTEAPTPEPTPVPWTTPPTPVPFVYEAPDTEKHLTPDYLRAVKNLVALAASGVGRTRLVRSSYTGRLAGYQFEDSHMWGLLSSKFENKKRYKHTVMDEDEIAFFMIRDNVTEVQYQTDHILYSKKKFICINDNINHAASTAKAVKKLLKDLMEQLFPVPSPFEKSSDLPQNDYLHTFEYPSHQRRKYQWPDPVPGSGLDPFFLRSMGYPVFNGSSPLGGADATGRNDTLWSHVEAATPKVLTPSLRHARFAVEHPALFAQAMWTRILNNTAAAFVAAVVLFVAGVKIARAALRFVFGPRRAPPVPAAMAG